MTQQINFILLERNKIVFDLQNIDLLLTEGVDEAEMNTSVARQQIERLLIRKILLFNSIKYIDQLISVELQTIPLTAFYNETKN